MTTSSSPNRQIASITEYVFQEAFTKNMAEYSPGTCPTKKANPQNSFFKKNTLAFWLVRDKGESQAFLKHFENIYEIVTTIHYFCSLNYGFFFFLPSPGDYITRLVLTRQ